jgi:hypothetical protein
MANSHPPTTGADRFFSAVLGFVFGGIGFTLLVLLWTASGINAPSLALRIFVSFFALAFIAMGGLVFFGTLKGQPPPSDTTPIPPPVTSRAGYVCPACGARLGTEADVSPRGDVKCGYCRKWFNIYG